MCHIPTYLKQLNLGESNISHQTPPSANLAGFAYYKKTCTFQKWRPKNAKQKRFTVPSPSLVSEGIRASKQSRNLHDLHWQPGVESAFRNYSNILSSVKYHGFTMNIYELSSLKTNMTLENVHGSIGNTSSFMVDFSSVHVFFSGGGGWCPLWMLAPEKWCNRKTIVSLWGPAYFQMRTVGFREGMSVMRFFCSMKLPNVRCVSWEFWQSIPGEVCKKGNVHNIHPEQRRHVWAREMINLIFFHHIKKTFLSIMMSKHGSYMLALSSLTSEVKCDMGVS